jgi:hypothetical protein
LTPPIFFVRIGLGALLNMATRLALLKTGDYIISDAKELLRDEKVCGYLFSNPHRVILNTPMVLMEDKNENGENVVNITLSPWIILSSDTDIAVTPDWVVTVVEPLGSLKKMFEEKVNGKECEVFVDEG